MRNLIHSRPTVGVLVSWPVYYGTTMMWYQHTVLRGIYTAAVAQGCNLLLSCGLDELTSPRTNQPAWPILSNSTTFVPVGPWNTDGLIVIGMYLSGEQEHYVRDLARDRFPLVFAGFEGPGSSVNIDNAGGIKQALEHLKAHGHRRIAFVAGGQPPVSESKLRLDAYRDLTQRLGLESDPRLIAYGDMTIEGGQDAMRQLLAQGVSFSAVLANNDSSAFGVTQVLRQYGLRVPEDVAVIGFDNLRETWTHAPPLTTIHNPSFAVGQQALQSVLEQIHGQQEAPVRTQIPVRLVIRRSCGCDLGVDRVSPTLRLPAALPARAHAMAEAVLLEAHMELPEAESMCATLIESFQASLRQRDATGFEQTLLAILQRVEVADDDTASWQITLAMLERGLDDEPTQELPARAFADNLLNRARQILSERTRQQAMRALLREENLATLLGQMTSQLLVTLDPKQIQRILAEHLPELNIAHACGALFVTQNDDPVAQSVSILSYGLAAEPGEQPFVTRQFPPPGMYAAEQPFQLTLLPLVIQEVGRGFIAFDAANLEPCAAIVRNLAAALRGSHLYSEALHGRQQAEEANRLKSRFLSMVSHELRTPLNLIVGLSELLLRQHPSESLPPTTVGDLERIYTSAQHLGQLIGDVLDLASSEAGQLHLLQEPLDLSEVLRVVATTGEYMAREKDLRWNAQLPSRGPWVIGDRTRLRQVALNLISNAIKFTDHGSVALSVTVEAGHVTVTISDTGLGVPLAEQTRIFDEFQQADITTARGYGGLGLGLAICRQLIERHGGSIGVHSSGEEGRGAEFWFRLPIMQASPLAEPPLLSLAQQTVVVLSHQAATAPWLMADLHEHDLELEMLDPTDDWLPRLLERPPQVILLDAQLAPQYGWQILGALQRHPLLEHIPLLICSLEQRDGNGALLELNYQRKPLDAAALTRLLFEQGMLGETAGDGATILVVDDDPQILSLHTRLIQTQVTHHRVLQAHNGREALTLMEQIRPNLVLLDLLMPELDGFGVLEAMRARAATRDVPVIVLTAQTLTDAEMERLNRGVAVILSKGMFSADEIVGHINDALARSQRLGDATQRLVRRAMAYIHTHYAEPIARSQIAQHIGITEDYLTDCFHQALGIPPITYLHRYRVKQARALLEAGDLSVTEVALTVGFADSTHFGRVFQREVGVTPSAYRRGKRA